MRKAMFQALRANVKLKRLNPANYRCFAMRAHFDQRLLGEDCAETSTREQLPLRVNKGL